MTDNIFRVRANGNDHLREKELSEKTRGWMQSEEVAAMLLFLCSWGGNRLKGAMIPFFGGL